jgi:hypothetical protein
MRHRVQCRRQRKHSKHSRDVAGRLKGTAVKVRGNVDVWLSWYLCEIA